MQAFANVKCGARGAAPLSVALKFAPLGGALTLRVTNSRASPSTQRTIRPHPPTRFEAHIYNNDHAASQEERRRRLQESPGPISQGRRRRRKAGREGQRGSGRGGQEVGCRRKVKF